VHYESTALTAELRAHSKSATYSWFLAVCLVQIKLQIQLPATCYHRLACPCTGDASSEVWKSRIVVNGTVCQFTTGVTNKNVAREIEATKRTELLKAQAGLDAPTLESFTRRFMSSLPGRVSAETATFYAGHSKPLVEFKPLAECRLDRIDSPLIELFISHRQKTVTNEGSAAAERAQSRVRANQLFVPRMSSVIE